MSIPRGSVIRPACIQGKLMAGLREAIKRDERLTSLGGVMMRFRATEGFCASLVFLLVSASHIVMADSLQGKFTFQKQPPATALVYFPEDTGRSPDEEVVIDQVNKAFPSPLVVASEGANVIFRNSDSVKHNIFARDRKAKVKIDLRLSKPGQDVVQTVTWNERVVKFGCKIHPKMKVWIASISSQYYKIVEFAKDTKTFNFELRDFPAHLSIVKVWIPKYPSVELRIKKGESQDIELYNWGKTADRLTLVRK